MADIRYSDINYDERMYCPEPRKYDPLTYTIRNTATPKTPSATHHRGFRFHQAHWYRVCKSTVHDQTIHHIKLSLAVE